jgi:hypothetical protein
MIDGMYVVVFVYIVFENKYFLYLKDIFKEYFEREL